MEAPGVSIADAIKASIRALITYQAKTTLATQVTLKLFDLAIDYSKRPAEPKRLRAPDLNDISNRFDIWQKLLLSPRIVSNESRFDFSSKDCVQRAILVILSYKKMVLDGNDETSRFWIILSCEQGWVRRNSTISKPLFFLLREIVVDCCIINWLLTQDRPNLSDPFLPFFYARCCKHAIMGVALFLRLRDMDFEVITTADLAYYFRHSYYWDERVPVSTLSLKLEDDRSGSPATDNMIRVNFEEFPKIEVRGSHKKRDTSQISDTLKIRFKKLKAYSETTPQRPKNENADGFQEISILEVLTKDLQTLCNLGETPLKVNRDVWGDMYEVLNSISALLTSTREKHDEEVQVLMDHLDLAKENLRLVLEDE